MVLYNLYSLQLFIYETCPAHAQAKLPDRFLEPNIKVSKITIIDPTPEKCHVETVHISFNSPLISSGGWMEQT